MKKTQKIKKMMMLIMLLTIIVVSACTNNEENNTNDDELNNGLTNEETLFKEFNECLAGAGIIIYGSEWCPACQALVDLLGGKNAVTPVYIECTQNQDLCAEEKKTRYVPEIQLRGEVYEGARSIAAFAQTTGCAVPN